MIGRDVVVAGSNSYEATAGSDIVVITAGLPRKPGMSRDDLLIANAGIVRKAVEESVKYSPEAIFVISNQPVGCYGLPGDEGGKFASKSCGRAGGNFGLSRGCAPLWRWNWVSV